MKRLIFHIGIHKTGTSFLQRTLHAGREALAKYGICYPELSENFAQHKLAEEIKTSTSSETSTLWNRLQEIVESTSHDTFIISTEKFDWYKRNQINKLRDLTRTLDLKVQIVFFIRNQIDFANSGILANNRIASLLQTTDERIAITTQHISLHFPEFIEIWSDRFGTDNVLYSVYEKTDDLVTEFFQLIRCPLEPGTLSQSGPVNFRNSSRDARVVLFFREFLKVCPEPLQPDLFHELRKRVDAAAPRVHASESATQASRRRTLFTPEQRQTLLLHFEPVNRLTDQQYIPLSDQYFTAERDWETVKKADPVFNRLLIDELLSRNISEELQNQLKRIPRS